MYLLFIYLYINIYIYIYIHINIIYWGNNPELFSGTMFGGMKYPFRRLRTHLRCQAKRSSGLPFSHRKSNFYQRNTPGRHHGRHLRPKAIYKKYINKYI